MFETLAPADFLAEYSIGKPYRAVYLTEAADLERAAEFDTKVFTEASVRNNTPTPATASGEDFKRIVEKNGRVIAFIDRASDEIEAIGVVIFDKDPDAPEPIVRNLRRKAVYMESSSVIASCQGQGYGRDMLELRLELARQAGKTEAFATVAKWNVVSANNLLARGFVLFGQQDNYFNMPEDRGRRYIAYHGDINNPDWAEQNIGPIKIISLLGPEVEKRWQDEIQELINFHREQSTDYCATHIEKHPDGSIKLHWSNFTGDRYVLPRLIYPYDSYSDAYQQIHGLDVVPKASWDLLDTILHTTIASLDERSTTSGQPIHTLGARMFSTSNQLFIQWVSEYRAYRQRAAESWPTKGFRTSFYRAHLDTTVEERLTQCVQEFLSYENRLLHQDHTPAYKVRQILFNRPLPVPADTSPDDTINRSIRYNMDLYNHLASRTRRNEAVRTFLTRIGLSQD